MKPFTDNTVKKVTKAIYELLSEFIIADEIVVLENLIKIKVGNTNFVITINRL